MHHKKTWQTPESLEIAPHAPFFENSPYESRKEANFPKDLMEVS